MTANEAGQELDTIQVTSSFASGIVPTVKTIKYIDQDDFDPSKVQRRAVVDPKVFAVVQECLKANERGEVRIYSPEESSSELDKLGYAIRHLKENRAAEKERAAAKEFFRR